MEKSVVEPWRMREAYYRRWRADYAKRHKRVDLAAIELGQNLVQTYAMGEARLSQLAHAEGMTLSGINVLGILQQQAPQGCPLNTLSHLLLVSRANITGLVDGLVGKHFVKRQNDPNDRRVTFAKITAEGEKWLNAYFPKHYGEISCMFAGLNAREKGTLVKLLTKLRHTSCRHPRETPGR